MKQYIIQYYIDDEESTGAPQVTPFHICTSLTDAAAKSAELTECLRACHPGKTVVVFVDEDELH